MNAPPTMTREEREAAAKDDWLNSDLSQREIAAKYGMSIGWLQNLARRRRWGKRASNAPPGPKRKKAEPIRIVAVAPTAEERAEQIRRDNRIYGDDADAVRFLRDTMHFNVSRYGGGYAVNNDVLTGDQLRALADQWRVRRGVQTHQGAEA